MESKSNAIVMKGLRRKVDLSKVQWNSDTEGIGEEIELTPEETEELKEQTRQVYKVEGMEWRGKVITLHSIDPLTGNLCPICLDFRDEAIESAKRKRRPRRRKKWQQDQSIGLAE